MDCEDANAKEEANMAPSGSKDYNAEKDKDVPDKASFSSLVYASSISLSQISDSVDRSVCLSGWLIVRIHQKQVTICD